MERTYICLKICPNLKKNDEKVGYSGGWHMMIDISHLIS
jgi:hypothetical protein